MKTAISVPNDVFELSDRLAKKLKVSRRKIFAMGVRKLDEEYNGKEESDGEDITARINAVCEKVDTSLDPFWKKKQSRILAKNQMVIKRGQIWWADLPEARGSSPGYEHPIVVVQSDEFNRTKINTIIGAVITSNIELAKMPGSVLLKQNQTELPEDSVVNVTQIVTVDKSELLEYVGTLSERKMERIENGLRLVLSL